MMNKVIAIFFLLSTTSTLSIAQQHSWSADSVVKLSKKVADWQLVSWEKDGMRMPSFDWTNGAGYAGFMALSKIANEPRYIDAMMLIGNSVGWNTGPHRFMADDYCVGQMFSQMYELYHEPKMIARFQPLADSIVSASHTESLEWINNIKYREWAWCDALFMGPPALAYLYTATGEKKYIDVADKLWWKTTDYLYDSTEHLFTRDSRYFDKKEANGKKVFWSRGNGWVMGGIVRMLENLPAEHPGRLRLISLYKAMADKIASIQHTDGTWHTALLDSVTYPAKETSGTGFYCYSLAYGINHGILDYNTYYPVVNKAWQALADAVHENGMLGYVQEINEKPGVVSYNNTAVYGVGAFLLAASQMTELYLNKSGKNYIQIINNTGLNRVKDVVEIPLEKLEAICPTFLKDKIKLSNVFTGEEIPYQLEYKGSGKVINVLAEVNVSPGSGIRIQCLPEKPSSFPVKTYARYIPERYDDFAWENDKIAFRMYGKALEKTKENAYGMDVWAKRTDRMIINERYKRGEYHIDHGDGMDFYHVGFSLGAGNIAGFKNDSFYFSKNYRNWKIIDSGALRTSFQLTFDAWNVAGKKITAKKIISIDAGSQLSKIAVTIDYDGKDTLPFVAGIVKRNQPGEMNLNEQEGLMGYWEPQHGDDGTIGVGVVLTTGATEMLVKKDHLLAKIQLYKNKPFVYYAGAAWDKAGNITNANEWFAYLKQFHQRINNPLQILIHKN